ncbi:phosphoadenosine phosphosulfate sulfotransferase [Cupriavidus taiwanensis]|uniref:3'-phosphoadenosine 5'-phosphosulfate sulfotransferase (PAPS reductase)/FAD synthetase Rme n=2 Tax=Cupriavidus TaxID=106589 RepID=A0A375JFF5_9BURK|nr:phosphoadenosine phosphosulfate sulfotransferase [Cupriavidus taiwanensis]SPS02723.1 3'-phosphoadenosine 5'-phosphosulfate sulfotransferase (PAPS reductase)/FAD synthetase Rme [Cupriavidus taiwanensis]
MQSISLFPVGALDPVEDRADRAIAAIRRLLEAGHPLVVAYSGGKDSSMVAALALHAATLHRAAGGHPLVVVTTSDTLVESPEVTEHYRCELGRMRVFGKRHGIKVVTRVVQPTTAATFQVKVLSGRALPSFPGTHGDCSTDLKILPQRAFRRSLFRQLAEQGRAEPVTLLGTRYGESARRNVAMHQRRESADAPARNQDGDLVLSPVCRQDDDIWEGIALYGSGARPGYSDFEDMRRIYAHAVGTSCAVVADAILAGSGSRRQGKCGARLGCHVCQMAEDKSLANMVEYDGRYAYAAGLQRLNRFIRHTRFDWHRRHWVGRTIRRGFIKIQPDTYHPAMVRALVRYMLQLDYDEQCRAERAGERPKFELLPLDLLIAVDALQSLNGLARPFAAWADWRDIRMRGIRYEIPNLPLVSQTAVPEARFLYVGEEWDDTAAASEWTGLRDPYLESFTADSACGPTLQVTGDGRALWALPTAQQFSVDPESAFLISEFELDRLLETHDAGVAPGQVTAGYRWYAQYGCLTLSHAQRAEHDEIARRTAYKDRLGLTLEYDIEALRTRALGFDDLPRHGQAAWQQAATPQHSLF